MVHLHRHIAAACFLSFSSSVLAVPATSSSNMAGGVDNGLDSATIPSGPAGFPHGFDFRKTFNAEVVFSASTGPHDGVVSSKGGEVFASIGDSNIEKDDQGPFKQAGEFPPSNADFNQSFSYFHNLYSMHPMFNTSMQSPQYPWPAKTNPTPPEQPVKIVRISENDGIGGALKFYDANGRQRVSVLSSPYIYFLNLLCFCTYSPLSKIQYFRGVNVLRKGDPWYPELVRWDAQYSFNDEDINFLAELNINIIRLGKRLIYRGGRH